MGRKLKVGLALVPRHVRKRISSMGGRARWRAYWRLMRRIRKYRG
jgi:hypothetical protein